MLRTAAFLAASVLLVSAASAQGRRPVSPAPGPSPAPLITPAALKTLKAREIGPAVMGGRVSEIAFDPADPHTFYVALATGGLMKTTDSGGSFKGVFEHEAVASTGAVAVAPSNPKVVWLGTGEANDRNSSAWGNGVYRSTDAGANWTQAGLASSKAIARIVVHPNQPETAWVAVAGDLWTPSSERGVYKTTDGGQTWKAVLAAPAPYGDRVGGGDLVIDPSNPQVLYAALYARRRTPWSFTAGPAATDGKDLGGIFKTTDGGTTWRKLGGGLPPGSGRIGLAVHAKDPKVVYAIVQSEEAGGTIDEVRSRRGGVFRSDDGGETWTRTSPLDPRPFYFSQIRVDPANDKRVYVLGFALHVSDDGGRSFREDLFEKVHPDNHALAIDARDPKHLLLGTDGGLYQSYKAGEGWEHLSRMAAGEFYRINVDTQMPYRICGGLQDN
ncbi:MAG TPA: glycosyl hydrolase, partial [Vicinamibacteria bacterium]|nr:glycosyl hydrolase [Vicinamibacteria bacterium]